MPTTSRPRGNQASFNEENVREQASRSINTTRGLPENTVYEDTGCDLAPSCLECPLALCKYDDPKQGQRSRTLMRDMEIMRLFANGMKISVIAREVNISDRTVYRVVQREMGLAINQAGEVPKLDRRRRSLHERVSIEQLDVWHQRPMRGMIDARAA